MFSVTKQNVNTENKWLVSLFSDFPLVRPCLRLGNGRVFLISPASVNASAVKGEGAESWERMAAGCLFFRDVLSISTLLNQPASIECTLWETSHALPEDAHGGIFALCERIQGEEA